MFYWHNSQPLCQSSILFVFNPYDFSSRAIIWVSSVWLQIMQAILCPFKISSYFSWPQVYRFLFSMILCCMIVHCGEWGFIGPNIYILNLIAWLLENVLYVSNDNSVTNKYLLWRPYILYIYSRSHLSKWRLKGWLSYFKLAVDRTVFMSFYRRVSVCPFTDVCVCRLNFLWSSNIN